MWEKEGAPWAMAKADTQSICAHLPLILTFLEHEDWWVRLAAWMAVRPLAEDEDLIRPVVPSLLACFADEIHYYPRHHYLRFLQTLHRKHDGLRKQIVHSMARSAGQTVLEPGYREVLGLASMLQTYNHLDTSRHPEHGLLIVDQVQRLLHRRVSQTHPDDRYLLRITLQPLLKGPALVKLPGKLGKEGGPMIAAFKTMLPMIETKAADLSRRFRDAGEARELIEEIKKAARQAIEEYEERYGPVKPAPEHQSPF